MISRRIRLPVFLAVAGLSFFASSLFASVESSFLKVEVTRPLVFELTSGTSFCLPYQQYPGGRLRIVGAPWQPIYLVARGKSVIGIDEENMGIRLPLKSLSGPGQYLIPDEGEFALTIGGCIDSRVQHVPGRYAFDGTFTAYYE